MIMDYVSWLNWKFKYQIVILSQCGKSIDHNDIFYIIMMYNQMYILYNHNNLVYVYFFYLFILITINNFNMFMFFIHKYKYISGF